MNPILYAIPIAYLIAMLVIGIAISRKQQTRSDFYVASSNMNTSVLFATIFSTVVGANTYMGFSGLIYQDGFSTAWLLAAAGSSYFLLFFISGKIRRIAQTHDVFTLPDLMELRYSRPVALLTTAFSMVALIGGAGGSILGVGVILHAILGINTTAAILITAVVTIAYTTLGGLMGVALTDWVQSIIMIIGLVLVIVFGINTLVPEAGFFSATFEITDVFEDAVGSGFLSLTEGVTAVTVIAWAITFMPLNTISQKQIQRIYAAKDERSIQRVSLLMAMFVGIFTTFGLALVGILGKILLPGISNPETVFPELAIEMINPVMGMVIVTSILGACMSTIDSNLLGASIHVSRDLYERRQRSTGEAVQEKQSVGVAQWSIVVIGAVSTVSAVLAPSIMDLLLFALGVFAGATFAPILFGLYWRRANSVGAMSGMLLGGMSTAVAEFAGAPLDPVIVGISFSITGTIAGSLLSKDINLNAHVFQFEAMGRKDIKSLIAVSVGFGLSLFGLTFLSLWPWMILVTVFALTASVALLVYYVVPRGAAKKVRIGSPD